MTPELLTSIGPDEAARYILDSRFWVQEKRDGVRLIVRKRDTRSKHGTGKASTSL